MLENPKINIKTRLCAFWASLMFCYIYGDYFELYVPEKVDSLLTGENTLNSPVKLFVAAVVLAIPALMIALSVILKPRLNRFLNIIFGVFFTLVMLVIAVNSLTAWYAFYVFLAVLEITISLLIVWYAWKWPRKKLV